MHATPNYTHDGCICKFPTAFVPNYITRIGYELKHSSLIAAISARRLLARHIDDLPGRVGRRPAAPLTYIPDDTTVYTVITDGPSGDPCVTPVTATALCSYIESNRVRVCLFTGVTAAERAGPVNFAAVTKL